MEAVEDWVEHQGRCDAVISSVDPDLHEGRKGMRWEAGVTRRQLTGEQRELTGPFLPIGAYDAYPERSRKQFERVI